MQKSSQIIMFYLSFSNFLCMYKFNGLTKFMEKFLILRISIHVDNSIEGKSPKSYLNNNNVGS